MTTTRQLRPAYTPTIARTRCLCPNSENKDALGRHFHAEIRSPINTDVGSHSNLTVDVQRQTWDVSLTAEANPVKAGESTELIADVDRSFYRTGYFLVIVDDDNDQTVEVCQYTSPCHHTAYVPYGANKDAEPLHFYAEMRNWDNGDVAGRKDLSLNVQRVTWDVTLTADPDPVKVGGSTLLTAYTDRSVEARAGYLLYIVDDDTGDDVAACQGTACPYWLYSPYSSNASPEPRHFHAEVRNFTNQDVAGRADVTVDAEQLRFGVNLSFGDPTSSGGAKTWPAQATVSPGVSSTGFVIRVRSVGGDVVASCGTGTTCDTTLGEGTYYATVEDSSGAIFGRSRHWSLSADDGAEDQTVDIYTLAGAFSSSGVLCNALLGGPGTHNVGSSATDQWLACDGVASAGGSSSAALKAVVALAGSAAVLLYISDYVDRYTNPETETVDPPPETPPQPWRPIPPPLLPSPQDDDDVDTLIDNNPDTFADRDQAKIAIQSCKTVATRNDCLSLPIFVPGDQDMPKTTKHDREAIYTGGQPPLLNWTPDAQRAPKEWYDKPPNNQNPCKDRDKPTRACDEYPFRSTRQGGPGASLKPIVRVESGIQGGQVSGFYTKCHMRTPDSPTFIVAPAPAHSNIPTLKICNGR